MAVPAPPPPPTEGSSGLVPPSLARRHWGGHLHPVGERLRCLLLAVYDIMPSTGLSNFPDQIN